MGFYRYIVRGLIGVGFCALFAGCGAADPEAGDLTEAESEDALVLATCTAPTINACTIYSQTSLVGRCCTCNGYTSAMRRSLLDPNVYNCKT